MDWKEARQLTEKVLQLKARLDNPQENENLDEIAIEYNELRQKLLEEMKACPYGFNKGDAERIFTEEELVAEGLLSSRKKVDHGQLPNLDQFTAYANYEATPGCTDVYFFGIPGAGNACMAMGLIGAEGNGFSINFRVKGGSLASAYRQYLKAGEVLRSTPGQFVTTINASIEEKRAERIINHRVNFVRISGEEFTCKIANNNDTLSLKDMGEGVRNLLRNNNRKVFFLVVDPTRENYNFTYDERILDVNGNIIGFEKKNLLVDQTECLAKFVDLFELPENKEFMKNMDAVHFIVTKADTLGKTQEERNRKAHDLLINKHRGSVYKLIGYCRRTKRVNRTTAFQPKIFTFSLGKFYCGGSFDYDSKDSLYLIDALRHMTQGTKESSGLGRLFGHASTVVQPTPGDYGIKINMDE